jgi:hypothetical protein
MSKNNHSKMDWRYGSREAQSPEFKSQSYIKKKDFIVSKEKNDFIKIYLYSIFIWYSEKYNIS